MEQPTSPEGINESQLIEALNAKEVEDPEAKELLEQYFKHIQAEANAEVAANPGDSVVTRRANIKADIKIAVLYSKIEKYKYRAYETLEAQYESASQAEATQDLAEQIVSLLNDLDNQNSVE